MLDIENLNVIYPDGTQAVRDLTLHIGKGESVAIVGANGAGKSTLMLSVVGICAPSSGSIRVEGMELKKENLRAVREKAGIVFQNPDDQLFMPSIYDDIAFGPRNYGVPEKEVQTRVRDVLESLHAAHLKNKMPHKLSGGEKRVAALASVLVMRPSIMLLDEPSSFLDPRARRNLIRLLKELSLTQVIATHDLDMALDLCARVVVLKEGAIFADGDVQTILSDQKLMDEAGLELPLCWLGGKYDG